MRGELGPAPVPGRCGVPHPAAPGDVPRRGTVQQPRTRPAPDAPPSQKGWHFGCAKHLGVTYTTLPPLLRVRYTNAAKRRTWGPRTWGPPLRGARCLPRKQFTGDVQADPPATSPSRWAAPGGQDLRGSSPALPSYSCFAAEQHFGQIAVERAFRRFVAARAARCSSRPAGDLATAMGCPGRPGFAGVVYRVAALRRFCRRAA